MSNKLKLTICHKNKGHTHTYTLTLKKFDQAFKRQGISETDFFFLELEAAAISAELGRDELGSIYRKSIDNCHLSNGAQDG